MSPSILSALGLVVLGLLAIRATGPDLPLARPVPVAVGDNPANAQTALANTREHFHADLQRLQRTARDYAVVAARVTSPPSPAARADLLTAHHRARRALKRAEWLVAHLDEQAYRRHLNGAPLPTVEPKVAEVRTVEPAGLQRLEEEAYAYLHDAGPNAADTASLRRLAEAYAAGADRVATSLASRRLTHAQVWAAARYGVVRIATMGITGFDTPASDEALAENAVALAAIRDGLAGYLPLLPAGLAESLTSAFARGVADLEGADFDDFDRLTFLREVGDPLYATLLDAQRALHVPLPAEGDGLPRPHDYTSRSLFADDFLDDFALAGLARDIDPAVTARKRDLGRRLFFDASLSASGELSCASCHDPARAFTDGRPRSLGADGEPVARNAPTLVAAVYAERYFADLREPQLARQVRHVVQDAHEFGTDYPTLLAQLAADSVYASAFGAAYAGLPDRYRVSTHSVGDALAHYVRGLHANASPVDRYLRGEEVVLAEAVERGANLFMGKAACATCHFAPTWSGLVPPYYRESESEVLGVPTHWPLAPGEAAVVDPDLGRLASGRPLDGAPFYAYSFKTPTVRNAALTAPYMHNGAVASLEQVVEFYNRGGGAGLGIDLPHQTLPFDSLSLSRREVADLVAFMEALTDEVTWE